VAGNSIFLKNPLESIVYRKAETVDRLSDLLRGKLNESLNNKENEFLKSVALLDGLSPLKTLSRGFTAVTVDKKTVKSIDDINVDSEINLRFADGQADCKVIKKYGV
jgi:exodeoxyribonuclease VII large subunit